MKGANFTFPTSLFVYRMDVNLVWQARSSGIHPCDGQLSPRRRPVPGLQSNRRSCIVLVEYGTFPDLIASHRLPDADLQQAYQSPGRRSSPAVPFRTDGLDLFHSRWFDEEPYPSTLHQVLKDIFRRPARSCARSSKADKSSASSASCKPDGLIDHILRQSYQGRHSTAFAA